MATTAAFAAGPEFTATLASPIANSKDVIADSNLFRCEGTTCKLVSKPIDATAVSTCRRLARQVGEIKAYGTASEPFDADKLSRCNAK